MSHPHEPADTSPDRILWWVAAALAVLCLAGWLFSLGTGQMEAEKGSATFLVILGLFRRLFWPLTISGLIFLSSASAGVLLIALLRAEPDHPLSRLLFAAGIGLGIFSTLTLVLGVLGLLECWIFWGLVAVLLAVGARNLWRILTDLRQRTARWITDWGTLEWGLLCAAGAFLVLALLCAGTPVFDYDTLEYHLGAPGEYYDHGRIHFLDHNVYAAFPQHVEMLYLGGIVLGGARQVGTASAVLTQALFGLLAALAIGRFAARSAGKQTGLPAALFFLSCPVLVVTVTRAHISLARCFYAALALLAVLEWCRHLSRDADRNPGAARRWPILAGLACGLAVAVKYPALLLLCVPIGVFVLAAGILTARTWRARLAPAALLTGCALMAAGPWFIRNVAHTGNPFFPLLYDLFGGAGWPAHQAAKFARAHAAPAAPSLTGVLRELWQFLVGHTGPMSPGFAGPLIIVFIPFLMIPRAGDSGKNRTRLFPLLFLAGYAVVAGVLWALFTHRIDRFLVPVLAPLAVLSAAGFVRLLRDKALRRFAFAAAVLLLVFSFWIQAFRAESMSGPGGTLAGETRLDLTRGPGMELARPYAQSIDWINSPDNVPAGATVMLVGEARIYPYQRDLLYSVVFNDHPIEPALEAAQTDLAEATTRLRATGADYILVNWPEYRRLTTSYAYEYEGKKRPGYLPQTHWPTRAPLADLLQSAATRIKTFGTLPWPTRRRQTTTIPVIEIYKITQ